MPRRAPELECSDEDKAILAAIVKSRTEEARAVERARIILACLEGKEIQQVARELKVSIPSVSKWRRRFSLWGLRGLRDQPRPGKPVRYDTAFRNRVLALLEETPPPGMSHWDGPAVAEKLDASVHAVWRVLRREGIYLQRRRSWCVSTDKEFALKAADVVGLYLNPPLNAVVLSVDEKPTIQAIERASGYVETDSGKVVRGLKSTYKRHGTLNLFAALEVDTGQVHTKFTEYKKREDFRAFLDSVLADQPRDRDIHPDVRRRDVAHQVVGRQLFLDLGRPRFGHRQGDLGLMHATHPQLCGRRAFHGSLVSRQSGSLTEISRKTP